MKRNKTFLALILAGLMVCSFLAGCNSSGDNSSSSFDSTQQQEIEKQEIEKQVLYKDGTHIFNVEKTNYDLLKKGTTNYKVVIKSGDSIANTAAKEFVTLFKEATGIILPMESDGEATYSASAQYISIGENAFQEAAGVEKPKGLKSNGYVIKTVGRSLVVLGGSQYGDLFGAYELLTQLFGYMSYSKDFFYIDKNVENKKLPKLDIYDNPDIDINIANNGSIYGDSAGAHRMRMLLQNSEVYNTTFGFTHNTTDYLPRSTYEETHPGWFSTEGNQLCYTAHGDEAEYEAMIAEITERVKYAIEDQPSRRIVGVMAEDNNDFCECQSCKTERAKYGGRESALNVKFTNRIAENIENWIEENDLPYEDIVIATFAYFDTLQAPVYKDANGNYVPYDESVVARENVAILYAPLLTMSFNRPYEHLSNQFDNEVLKGWEVACSHFSVWGYQTHFKAYFTPYDTWVACQQQYLRYIQMGAEWVFDQGQHDNANTTHFTNLKMYLASQWSWDVNRDYTTLVDNYFANYFGSKDGGMRKYYEELRKHLEYLSSTGKVGTKPLDETDKSGLYSLGLLLRWMDYIEEAYKDIEDLESSDPTRYEAICEHINLESIMVRYFLIQYYGASFSIGETTQMKRDFAADCARLNITRYRENGDIDGLIGGW